MNGTCNYCQQYYIEVTKININISGEDVDSKKKLISGNINPKRNDTLRILWNEPKKTHWERKK